MAELAAITILFVEVTERHEHADEITLAANFSSAPGIDGG